MGFLSKLLGGGGGTSTTTQQPWAQMQPYLKDMFGRAQGAAGAGAHGWRDGINICIR